MLMRVLARAVHLAEVPEKAIAYQLGFDQSQWTRCKQGKAHLPVDRLERLMDSEDVRKVLRWAAALVTTEMGLPVELARAVAVYGDAEHKEAVRA